MKILRVAAVGGFALALAGCQDITNPSPAVPSASPSVNAAVRVSQIASMYAVDVVSTAATGASMNDGGDVVGTSYLDTGCGPFCLPPQQTVAWVGGNRIVLPTLPGFSGIYPQVINAQGWIAGTAGVPGTTTHAVVWRPNGASYTITDLGLLPGTTVAQVAGMDNQGRIVGWMLDNPGIPTTTAPFVWSSGGGLVNLASLGFPNDPPESVSPNGHVATYNFHYQLGNAASVVPMPAPPRGYLYSARSSVVNDAGDQGRFLVSTSSQNLLYPFRYTAATNALQQLSAAGSGHLTRAGMGSINNAQDILATVQSTAMIAAGPSGLLFPLATLLSPAYPGVTGTGSGPMNAGGQILSSLIIGASPRLVRMTPTSGCAGNCARVSKIQMAAKFVQDPRFPGSCFQGGTMRNDFGVRVTVTSETGAVLPGAVVTGRFLDSYWMDKSVSGTTNAQGWVQLQGTGPCGTGTIAFFVDNVTSGGRTFDRVNGILTKSKIPQ
ncbi:MAG: hypothetical protein U0132_10240 [Gemmatimonadaceae bacterium]